MSNTDRIREVRILPTGGVREINPKRRRFFTNIAITRSAGGTVRQVIGFIRPLEFYSKTPMDLLGQYTELILLSTSGGITDEELDDMMLEARGRLPDVEYTKLLGYRDLITAQAVRG